MNIHDLPSLCRQYSYTAHYLTGEQKNECPAECWSYMPLMSFSIIRDCRSYPSGSYWHTRMFYLLLTQEGSQAMTSQALQVFLLPGATALCYTAPSSRLLIPISPHVWRQSVQVGDHHLCPGMPLNLVYDDPGDDVGAFPACLQLG